VSETIAYYVRVSTNRQNPDRQLREIREYLGDEQFRAARAYSDIGVSGAKDDREEFQRLWNDVEAGEVDRVVSWEMSRLSRRLSTAAEFMELCADEAVALETLNDMFPNLRGGGEDDIWDEMLAKFSAWMMEFEREMTRERIVSGVHNAIEEGKWVGRPPYGFETDEDGHLRVEPDEFVRMQLAIEDVVHGDAESASEAAEERRVPDSTLYRVLDDPERRELYLLGEHDDPRVAGAVEESGTDPAEAFADLEARIAELEAQVEDDVDE